MLGIALGLQRGFLNFSEVGWRNLVFNMVDVHTARGHIQGRRKVACNLEKKVPSPQ